MKAHRGRFTRLRERATSWVMLVVALGFAIFVVIGSRRGPAELGCEQLCEGARSHCVFTDHTACLAHCAADDSGCRARCAEGPHDCAVHCSAIVLLGCEEELQGLYGCVILHCADPERDVWQACDVPRRKYESCSAHQAAGDAP